MEEKILIGKGKKIVSIPRSEWEGDLKAAPAGIAKRLEFMTPDHHLVRNFVVRKMPAYNRPISVSEIAEALDLPVEHTAGIVSELEKNLFFLVRKGREEVAWAFPVTADQTPHHLAFSTGERLDAA